MATLFLLVAVFASLLLPTQRIRENRSALAVRKRFGGDPPPPAPWVARFLPARLSSELWPRQADGFRVLCTFDNRTISDDDLVGVNVLRELRILELPTNQDVAMFLAYKADGRNPRRTGSRITNEGLKHLEGLPRLESLGLFASKITDEGLRSIGTIRTLEELQLAGTSIDGSGLEYLSKLNRLRFLGLGGTNLTDDNMRFLSSIRSLQALDLTCTRITDKGLRHLTSLPELFSLDLSCTGTTDKAAEIIGGIKTLGHVQLGKTGFTWAGGTTLRSLLPNIEVAPDGICPRLPGQPRLVQ